MTYSSSEARFGQRLAGAAMTGCLAAVLLAGLPARAEDANPVLAKVNGAEIRQSDVAIAEEELGPSLAQMDPATKRENVVSFLIDMKIVAKERNPDSHTGGYRGIEVNKPSARIVEGQVR